MARIWTREEVEFLENQIGIMKVDSIANSLKRPVKGVIIKMKRLGIGHTKSSTGALTRAELANILGVDSKTVEWWNQRHGLPFKSRVTRHIRRYYFIEPSEFWDWAFKNSERIDFSKIESNSIVPEPDWVKVYRRNNERPKGNKYRKWTVREEEQLMSRIREGESIDYISRKLKRTPESLRKKYKRLVERKRSPSSV